MVRPPASGRWARFVSAAATVAAAAVAACGSMDSSKSGARADGAGPRTLHWDVLGHPDDWIDGNFELIFHGERHFSGQ